HQDRLQHALHLDRVREAFQFLRIEVHTGLKWIGVDLIDRDICNDDSAVLVPAASRIAQQRGKAAPQSRWVVLASHRPEPAPEVKVSLYSKFPRREPDKPALPANASRIASPAFHGSEPLTPECSGGSPCRTPSRRNG